MISIGDVVVVHVNDKPSAYARVDGIEPDTKPGWFRVRLLLLGFPPQEVIWILRREYMEGAGFTMQDIPMRIIPLEGPNRHQASTRRPSARGPRVIPLRRGVAHHEDDGDPPSQG
jgi:hypothetical protein